MATALPTFSRDVRVVGLVGVAHGGSHFFQLVLPPLFPLLKVAFGVDYLQLGLVMTVFFATSGLCQTPAGFLVDRVGAARVLAGGLFCLGTGALIASSAPSYIFLLPAAAVLGLGNSVFHPADYSILSHHVDPTRMARAFSVHTIGGTIGWALAPVVMAGLASLYSWRLALAVVGVLGLGIALSILLNRTELETPSHATRAAETDKAAASIRAVLLSAPILMCFAYFALQASAMVGLQSFMPLALVKLWHLPLVAATATVTTYMIGSAAGTLVGGILADRSGQHQRIIAGGIAFSALAVLAVGTVAMPVPALLGMTAIAGALAGMTTPSRDMLVRAAAPKGSSGKVFGFVYSGLDLGATLTPAAIGLMLDHDLPQAMFVAVAIVMALTIFTAVNVRTRHEARA
ncbi:MAG: MFS transporter [Geminicoccaceae bacterium]